LQGASQNEEPCQPTPRKNTNFRPPSKRLHERYRDNCNGDVATYIPELGKADPNDFGISLATTNGAVFQTGDFDRPFTIQSISKPFTFGIALETYGHSKVAEHVGVEPSGDAFNAIELQNGTNRPFNPMINSGAITVTALLHKKFGEETFDLILDRFSTAAGRSLQAVPIRTPLNMGSSFLDHLI